ncbi:hypothetical protein C7212DRAFT_363451 [Tuber magnatum]|uniref:P-loop containing nucleoside triphosphate hydrolase protein n=1 Tax=Tuber magnatum TaxID=42249 RepID=A0A317SUQ0_9PEZI|nr:hypothetical protein C7212DRAFT_363451 [Tuber magnatum]
MKFYKYFTCSCCRRSGEGDCVAVDISTGTPTTATATATTPPPPPPPPTEHRCLVLGLSGAGKSTFLARVRTGQFQETEPTEDYEFQEILLSNQIINFTEIGNSDRRNFRLQFLRLEPIPPTSLLFFIDSSRGDSGVAKSLEELAYALMYARDRGCRVRYLGIVLNKQDLLLSGDDQWRGRGKVVEGMVCETMKQLLPRLQEKRDAQELVVPLRWEVFGDGVSMKTGAGVERILKGVGAGIMMEEEEEQGEALPVQDAAGDHQLRLESNDLPRSKIPCNSLYGQDGLPWCSHFAHRTVAAQKHKLQVRAAKKA